MAQELTVVVTGSTGKQGGAVARGFLNEATRSAPSPATQTQARPSCWRTLGRVDRTALRREFPDIAFHDFESLAKGRIGTRFGRVHRGRHWGLAQSS